jgi:hypothetical protein
VHPPSTFWQLGQRLALCVRHRHLRRIVQANSAASTILVTFGSSLNPGGGSDDDLAHPQLPFYTALNSVGAHERRPLPQPERATLVRIGVTELVFAPHPAAGKAKKKLPDQMDPRTEC